MTGAKKGLFEMGEHDWLAARFEANRPRLRAVAYRMLGSLSEADDAVQESWLRLTRSSTAGIENLTGWLTTVVARVSLNMLRSRRTRREEVPAHVPDPIVSRPEGIDPEQAVLLADSVGLALLVVLETLAPVERLAFVLHDMFAVPFEEIAPIVGRSPTAARQLASRARRRVQGSVPPVADVDRVRQREVVDAFLQAARAGDFGALIAILDPDVVLRADSGTLRVVRGARAVAEGALTFSRLAEFARPALVNGVPGIVASLPGGRPFAVLGFSVRNGKIVDINILTDPARLRRLDLTVLAPQDDGEQTSLSHEGDT
jgi:RNA polymerase sigma factor (sigma-70 family)